MFQKTKAFSVKGFWEQKLNIKYDKEIEYYKKFCGVSYKYKMLLKNPELYNDSEDITYDNWKKHILKTIENLSIKELREYSRFLNQENVSRNMAFGFWQTFVIPYTVMIISTYITMTIPVFEKYGEVIYSFFVIMCLCTIVYIFKKMSVHIIESRTQNFYYDMKEIVDEKIELIKTDGEEEQQ